jgi:hypothetical protein
LQHELASLETGLEPANLKEIFIRAEKVIELAQTAYSQCLTRNFEEKRKLLQTIRSNSTYYTRKASTYKKPFDIFAEGWKSQWRGVWDKLRNYLLGLSEDKMPEKEAFYG